MNIPRLKKLLAHLKTLKPGQIDMGVPLDLVGYDDCGTVGCIAGWAVALFNPKFSAKANGNWHKIERSAERLLGLKRSQSGKLFYSCQWGQQDYAACVESELGRDAGETNRLVIKQLSKFIRRGTTK